MNVDAFGAIEKRRSIRRFSDKPLPREVVERILQAGIEAPSAKNAQPWRFVVVQGNAKAEMLRAMDAGLAKTEREFAKELPWFKWTKVTARIMRQAPVTVFVLNPAIDGLPLDISIAEKLQGLALTQSVGAAIQNMCLAATALDIGSLWICDIFYAYDELAEWLGTTNQMVAAVSFGYALESPERRPRKQLSEVTEWRS